MIDSTQEGCCNACCTAFNAFHPSDSGGRLAAVVAVLSRQSRSKSG